MAIGAGVPGCCQDMQGYLRTVGASGMRVGSAFTTHAGPWLSDDLTGRLEQGTDRRGLHPTGPRQRQLEFGRRGIQATAHDALVLTLLNR